MGCIVSDGEFVLPSGKRTDLTLRLATDPRAMQIDTSIVQPSCDTYCHSRAQSKPLHAALHREEVKRKKYEAEVTAIGDTFSPFVWESYGAPAPSVISTVELIRTTGQIRGLDPLLPRSASMTCTLPWSEATRISTPLACLRLNLTSPLNNHQIPHNTCQSGMRPSRTFLVPYMDYHIYLFNFCLF